MEGTTYRIASADFSQLVKLSNGEALLVRSDGGPHRYCSSPEDAMTKAGIAGDPNKLQLWAKSNPGKSDDGWDNQVSFRGETLAAIKAKSQKEYDEPERREAERKARAEAPAERKTMPAEDSAD